MTGLVGGPLLVGGLGSASPGPLKSGPAPLSQWGRVPASSEFLRPPTCAHIVWETTSKLHGDQITREEYYYTFDHECWLLFAVTNFLVKNNLVSQIRHITAHVQWPEYWKTTINKHLGAGIYANSGSVVRLATRSACGNHFSTWG